MLLQISGDCFFLFGRFVTSGHSKALRTSPGRANSSCMDCIECALVCPGRLYCVHRVHIESILVGARVTQCSGESGEKVKRKRTDHLAGARRGNKSPRGARWAICRLGRQVSLAISCGCDFLLSILVVERQRLVLPSPPLFYTE